MKFGLVMDSEIRAHRYRPPCPCCSRKTWPVVGLDNRLVFYCFIHGYWMTDPVESDNGDTLPFFRWRTYDWRFL